MTVVISLFLSLSRSRTNTYIHLYTCIHACAFGRRSASVCRFLFFLFSFIAQNRSAYTREREKGNSMMMSILWHRAHTHIQKERGRESSKISRERTRERTLPGFFFFSSILYSVSSFLSSANCMSKQ